MNKQQTGNFFSVADRVGTFLFANFIWIVVSMSIIGIPFAILGLFAMMNHLVRGRQPEVFRVFFGTIREHWRKALVIGLLDTCIGGLLVANLWIFQMMTLDNMIAMLSLMMTIAVALVLIMTNIYIWSFMSLLDLNIKNLIKLSLIISLTYPMRSIGLTLLYLSPIVIGLFFPIAFTLFFTVSLAAYVGSRGSWYMLHFHFVDDELNDLLLA